MFIRITALASILCASTVIPVSAQNDRMAAEIRNGSCGEGEGMAFTLVAPARATGPQQGGSAAVPAANSFSTVSVPMSQLTTTDYVIVIEDGDDSACGLIGGPTTDTGALVMGLESADRAKLSGVAFLAPSSDGGQTNISLFVTGNALASADESVAADDSQSVASQQSTETDTVTATESVTTPEQPTAAPEPTQPANPVGTASENPSPFFQPVTNGGSTVTMVNGYFANAYGYSTPQGGYKYLVLDVTIECAGPDNCNYNPMNFSGEDADTGAGYDSVVFAIADGMLSSDTLSPSEYVTGTVLIEVQETASRVIVKYDPKSFDTNDLYWLFQ
jgi:hypothetical protein